ncbi:MAG TPA: hypothetical protein GX717_08255 [Clostridiaceae bacterium]|nr:hypothetical protein [Clostridiaceae bacterium]
MDHSRFKQTGTGYTNSGRQWKSRRPHHTQGSIQDNFLKFCVKNGSEVQVHLKNDSVKTGFIRGFDNWTLILAEQDEQIIMLFKSAVTAITPLEALFWQDLEQHTALGTVAEPQSLYDRLYH